MKPEKKKLLQDLMFLIMIASTLTLQILMAIQLMESSTVLENYNRHAMYQSFFATDYTVNGYYKTDGYYCVWTAGRTIEEINNTDYHEVCHELIHKDKDKHFCKRK